MKKQIIGYEFLLSYGSRCEWTQLQGCGGALGNGALHVQDGRKARRIARKALIRARTELEREGEVRQLDDGAHYSLRIVVVKPIAVLACRPFYVRAQPLFWHCANCGNREPAQHEYNHGDSEPCCLCEHGVARVVKGTETHGS